MSIFVYHFFNIKRKCIFIYIIMLSKYFTFVMFISSLILHSLIGSTTYAVFSWALRFSTKVSFWYFQAVPVTTMTTATSTAVKIVTSFQMAGGSASTIFVTVLGTRICSLLVFFSSANWDITTSTIATNEITVLVSRKTYLLRFLCWNRLYFKMTIIVISKVKREIMIWMCLIIVHSLFVNVHIIYV